MIFNFFSSLQISVICLSKTSCSLFFLVFFPSFLLGVDRMYLCLKYSNCKLIETECMHFFGGGESVFLKTSIFVSYKKKVHGISGLSLCTLFHLLWKQWPIWAPQLIGSYIKLIAEAMKSLQESSVGTKNLPEFCDKRRKNSREYCEATRSLLESFEATKNSLEFYGATKSLPGSCDSMLKIMASPRRDLSEAAQKLRYETVLLS